MSKWEETYLTDFANLNYGDNLPSSILKPYGFKVFGANGYIGYNDNYNLDKQTVLISCRGEYSGTINIVPEKTFVTNNSILVNLKTNDVDTIFIYYKLQTINKALIVSGSAQPQVTIIDLKRVTLKLPRHSEQQRIARILSTADAVIEKTQAAIAKYKAIKQGMLQDLFTRGVMSEKVKVKSEKGEEEKMIWKLRPRYEDAPHLYKESKLGMIPREWDVDTLDNLTDKIGSGVTPTGGSEVYKASGVLFIRSQNVLIGSLSIEDAAFITIEIDQQMEGSRVKPFDVLLNITGASIGRCAYFPENLQSANVNQHVCIIRFKQNSKPQAVFAAEYFNSDFIQRQIYKAMAVGNREGLNFQQTKAFIYPVIDTEELNTISPILENLNNKLQTEQTYLQKMQLLKKGLMEDLLSGKKQVKVSELGFVGFEDDRI